MRTLLCSTLLAALFVAPPKAPIQEGIELRWRGQVGDVLRLRLTMSQTVTNSMMPEPFESESAMVMRQEVKEVSADGVGSLDVAYEAIRMTGSGPAALDYDSTRTGEAAKANDPTLVAMMGPLLEADVHMKIAPTGRILEVGGLEHAFDGMGVVDPNMGKMFEGMFGGESVKRMLEVNVFPEKKLVAGDTWQREVALEAPMLGTLTMRFDNTFEGTEMRGTAECARIGVRGTMELGGDDLASPVKMTLDDSSFSGTMFLALENGFLLESTMDTSMTLAMDMPSGGQGMTMDMEMTQVLVRIGAQDPLFE